MPVDSKDKITLFLGNAFIKKVKIKSIEDDKSVSAVCRALLDTWQTGLLGYEAYKDRSKLPPDSAVYLVIDGSQVIYVGQTTNLKQRFLQHHHTINFSQLKGDLAIFWFKLDKKFLVGAERLCIDLLEPEFNNTELRYGSSGTAPNTSICLTEKELQFINQIYGGRKSVAIHASLELLMKEHNF